MSRIQTCNRISLLFFALFGLLLPGHADVLSNNEIEFTGTISSVVVNGEGVGTVFIRLQDFDLRVVVNSLAEILDEEGEEISMEELAADDEVEIRGKFSASGILASQIRLLAGAKKDFHLKGHITAVQTSGSDTLISLLGITVRVTAETKIEQDGAKLSASDLKVGMMVSVEGTISGSTWTATSIKVSSEGKKKGKLTFEGTIKTVAADKIEVEVTGITSGLTKVLITSNTRIIGTLEVGVNVTVKGFLNADLSVTAREIRILSALEIKPDERKIKVGETAMFTVKLRESAANDVVVTLKSSDTAVLTLSKGSLTILKGTKTADFTAKGVKIGSAEITAEALGDKATAKVKVGEVSDEENEKPGAGSISFAPDKIKLGLNETRDVVLLIKPPQKSPLTVKFSSKNGIVTVDGTRELGMGAASMKVTIQSSTKVGTDSVIATLPDSAGGGKAELLVEVGGKGDDDTEKVEIDFHPDEIKIGVGESRSVKLNINRPLNQDVTVALKSSGPAVQVASTVIIQAGSKMVSVSVTGKSEGKASVEAALPSANGGDTAKLEVEVKKK